MDIAEHDALALFPAEHFFVRTFKSELPDVVSTLIIGVGIDVGLIHLTDVAQHKGRPRTGITTDGALLGRKTIETEELFTDFRKLLSRNLTHEKLGRIARIVWMFFRILDICHTGDVFLPCDTHGIAEIEGVDAMLVLHDDVDIVRRLIIDHQTSLAVEDKTARRE